MSSKITGHQRFRGKYESDLAAQVPQPLLSQPLNVQDQKTHGPKSIPRPIQIAYYVRAINFDR